MGMNKILINDFVDGRYREKSKARKLDVLYPYVADRMLVTPGESLLHLALLLLAHACGPLPEALRASIARYLPLYDKDSGAKVVNAASSDDDQQQMLDAKTTQKKSTSKQKLCDDHAVPCQPSKKSRVGHVADDSISDSSGTPSALSQHKTTASTSATSENPLVLLAKLSESNDSDNV